MLELCLRWQLKYMRVATRFGLLAEACLALLLLPILRGLSLFRILGVQFETSVRYHVWLGTAMISFATFHGLSTLFIWGVSHHIQEEVINHSFSIREVFFFVLFYWGINNWSISCLFVFYYLEIDLEMAEKRKDILGWWDCSSYRTSDLDHSASSNKKTKVRNLLLHTPSLCGLPCILLVSCGRPPLLLGFRRDFPLWTRQVTPNHTIETRNMRSVSENLPLQSHRTRSAERSK